MKRALLAAAAALGLAAAPIIDNGITEKNYRIYSVKQGKEVSLDDIVNDMKNYDVLFYGEEHNDSVTHYLEKTLLEKLHGKYGRSVALSMEMFDRDVQGVLNEYLGGHIREKNFTKDARAWSNYRDYRPMIEFAKEKQLDVIAANAPGRYSNLAGRKGQAALNNLPSSSKAWFAPVPYDTASGAYYEKLMGVMHGPSDKKAANDTAKVKPVAMPAGMGGFNMNMGQSLWDATMAWSISEYAKNNKSKKIMQVNGKFHSDEGFGIVGQLKKYDPKLRTLIITSDPADDFPNADYSSYKGVADYIIITDPSVPRTYN